MGQSASGACCNKDKNDRDFLLEPGRAVASDEVVRPETEREREPVKTLSSNPNLVMTRFQSPKHLKVKDRGPLSGQKSDEVGGPLATVLSDEESEDGTRTQPVPTGMSRATSRASAGSRLLSVKDTDSQADSSVFKGKPCVMASPDRWGGASLGVQSYGSRRRSDGSVAASQDRGSTGQPGGKPVRAQSRISEEQLSWKKPSAAFRASMRYMGSLLIGDPEEDENEFIVELLEVALAVCCASAGDFSSLAKAATKDDKRSLRKLAEFAKKNGFLTDDNVLFTGSITLKELAKAFLNSKDDESAHAQVRQESVLSMRRDESALGMRRAGDSYNTMPTASSMQLPIGSPFLKQPSGSGLDYGGMSKNLSQHLLSRTTSDISASSFTDFNKKYSRARNNVEDASAPSLLEYLSAMAMSLNKKQAEMPPFTDQGHSSGLVMDMQFPSGNNNRHGDMVLPGRGLTWASSFQSDGAATYHSATDLVIMGEGDEKEVVQADIVDLACNDEGTNRVRIAFRSRCLRTQNEWQRHLLAQQRSLLKLAKQRKEAAEQQLKQDEEVKEEQKELLRGFRKIIQRDIDQRLNHRASVVVVDKKDELRKEVEGLCGILEYPCKPFSDFKTAKNEVQSAAKKSTQKFEMDRRATPQLLAGRPGGDFQDWRSGALAGAAPGDKTKTVQEVQMRIILLSHMWLERDLPQQWLEDEDIVIVLTSEAEEFEEVGRTLLASGEAEIRERLREKGISDYLLFPLSLESLQEIISQAIHRRFGDEYLLLQALGRGGSGVVHQAKRLKDGCAFALKEISTRRLTKTAKQDVEREAKLLQELKWPTVVFVVDSWENQQAQLRFLLMPLLKGGNLLDCIEAARKKNEQVCRDRIGGWYAQTLHGLAYLHWRGVMHRDVKPGNLLLAEDQEVLQIGDLGSAVLLPGQGPHPAKRSKVRSNVSTPAYSAPEVYREEVFMAPSDIWAVGVSFYEVMTLQPLFVAETTNKFQDMICAFDIECTTSQSGEAQLGPRAYAALRESNMGSAAAELTELLRRDPLRRPTAAALVSKPASAHRLRNVLTKWTLQKNEVKQHFDTFARIVRESEAAAEMPGVMEEERRKAGTRRQRTSPS